MSPNVEIRTFRTEDEAQVISLWERSGLVRPWNDPHKDILRKLQVQAESFLVGEIDDEIVATTMVGYDGHRGWIYYLAVAPEHQRTGVGRQIVNEAERILRACGCPKINLQVRRDNLQAVAFYHSLGYVDDDVVSLGKRLVSDEGHE